MTIHSKKSGYTLLFAVLISTLILGIAVFISGIARKQYILSSTALDSMYSLYAADSGIECVAASGVPSSTAPVAINCNSQPVTPSYTVSTPGLYPDQDSSAPNVSESTFNFGFYPPSPPSVPLTGCAVIKIDTYKETSGGYHAIIVSRGYNLCTKDPITGAYGPNPTSPRTVERALRLDYL
jgi:hypothetical protein